eukprot:GHVU01168858.1.p1 GENE.GHVU01168858.1~~GHVU01168858.1.p1  ORF type:complete len:156 (-),score=24.90 GHVU01168858.1:1269-1736(-)
MSIQASNPDEFQHILRLMNSNVDGTQKVWVGLRKIKGVGRRFSVLVCKKADIDLARRAGQLTEEEQAKVVQIITQPTRFKIPNWMLNRQRDYKDGTHKHVASNGLDSMLRDDLDRLKKMRSHRGLRHHWGLRVRGQHTRTTGRGGRAVGVSGKKK